MRTLEKIFLTMLILFISAAVSFAFDYTGVKKVKKLDDLFKDANVIYYDGSNGIGINHIAYWTMSDEDVAALAPEEQAKVAKIRANGISSMLYPPDDYDPIPGYEVTGTLVGGRKKNQHIQTISLVIPDNWNGKLIVLGTPGTRNEYGEASLMSPWLLERGYATIEGDKGMPGGNNDLLNGNHVTQHWGAMMIDMARAAQKTIKKSTGMKPLKTYAAGMSNGGFQTRLALELDHARVLKGKRRLFDGGLAWSGSYYPREEVLDTDADGTVTVAEYVDHANITLFGAINKATMLMGWAHAEDSITNPENFNSKLVPFPTVYGEMLAMGFHPDSARMWGAYNSCFDYYKNYYYYGEGYEAYAVWAGIGYLNFSAYYYLAEARGDNAEESNAYTAYNLSGDPANPIEPPLYAFLEENADTLGFNEEAVEYFLKIANSAEFSVPLVEIHGTKDSLVPTIGQGLAYKNAVEKFGNPELHRLYLIENGMHVEYQVDVNDQGVTRVDFDFNEAFDDEAVTKEVTPMQGYAMLAMDKLEGWVEDGDVPVESQTVLTDPETDYITSF